MAKDVTGFALPPDVSDVLNDPNSGWYTLDEHNNPVKTTLLSAEADGPVVVCHTQFNQMTISTVFLRLDHNHGDIRIKNSEGGDSECIDKTPILFETMVFNAEGTPWENYQDRYATWDEAEAGHQFVISAIEATFEASICNYLSYLHVKEQEQLNANDNTGTTEAD